MERVHYIFEAMGVKFGEEICLVSLTNLQSYFAENFTVLSQLVKLSDRFRSSQQKTT